MGTYHTFFVADEAELDRLFPGWQPVQPSRVGEQWKPLAPVRRLGKPNLYDARWGPALPPVFVQDGEWASYARMVEEAGAPGLRALPHFRAKNVEALYEFDALNSLLTGDTQPVAPARLGNPADDDVAVVYRLPVAATRALVSLGAPELRQLTERLLRETDLSGSADLSPDGVASFIHHVLGPLVVLGREAEARGAEVCHYMALHH